MIRTMGLVLFSLLVWVLLLSALTGIVLMFGWNMSMPHIFGMKTVDFWQAFGLSLVANVLIGAAKSSFTLVQR